MSTTSKGLLFFNGMIWLLLVIGMIIYANHQNYYAATFLLFMYIQVTFCLVMGLILVFTPYTHAGKGLLLSGVLVGTLTLMASGYLLGFR